MTSQELQAQMLKLSLQERWELVQTLLSSIQHKTAPADTSAVIEAFEHISYRTGFSGDSYPVVKGTRIRVQTIVSASQDWEWTPYQIASEYDLAETQVLEALKFYELHSDKIEAQIAEELAIESVNVSA
ncbi:MAG: DUF433 domain-containing protein [Cyanobacteria bacterium P01_D01_bin.1]